MAWQEASLRPAKMQLAPPSTKKQIKALMIQWRVAKRKKRVGKLAGKADP